jgi:NAD(P)-dependent dehydrogenase (short-subunit alcohol dehydrogenase family)
MTDKVAIVTGASRGLGRNTAVSLAALVEGAHMTTLAGTVALVTGFARGRATPSAMALSRNKLTPLQLLLCL